MKKIIFVILVTMFTMMTPTFLKAIAQVPSNEVLNEKIEKKDICGFLTLFKFECGVESIQKNILTPIDEARLKINFYPTAARECAYWVSCYQHTPTQWVILMTMMRDNKEAFVDGKLTKEEIMRMVLPTYDDPPKSFATALEEGRILSLQMQQKK
jgi:hypothetical protein